MKTHKLRPAITRKEALKEISVALSNVEKGVFNF